MTQDVFIEKLVSRKNGMRELILQCFIVVLAVNLIWLSLDFLAAAVPVILPIVIVGILYGTYYIFQLFRLEYEYILTNGELDIDRITAKRRRKRLYSVDTRNFEVFGRMSKNNAQEFEKQRQSAKIADCASSLKAEGRYFAAFTAKSGGRVLLIFEPDERMVEIIAKLNHRKVLK